MRGDCRSCLRGAKKIGRRIADTVAIGYLADESVGNDGKPPGRLSLGGDAKGDGEQSLVQLAARLLKQGRELFIGRPGLFHEGLEFLVQGVDT